MSFKVDFSSIKTVRIHKEQFDSIEKNANSVIIECVDDGRIIGFNRAESEAEKIKRLNKLN